MNHIKKKKDLYEKDFEKNLIEDSLFTIMQEWILPEEKQNTDTCSCCKKNKAQYLFSDNFFCEECLMQFLSTTLKITKGRTFKYDDNNPRDQKPNELCKCGSGKKYKKCCKNK